MLLLFADELRRSHVGGRREEKLCTTGRPASSISFSPVSVLRLSFASSSCLNV